MGALQAVFSQEQLSPKVLETVQYLSWLFGDAPLGIDAIGELVDGQFRHLVFNDIIFGPEIHLPNRQKIFIDALLAARPKSF